MGNKGTCRLYQWEHGNIEHKQIFLGELGNSSTFRFREHSNKSMALWGIGDTLQIFLGSLLQEMFFTTSAASCGTINVLNQSKNNNQQF